MPEIRPHPGPAQEQAPAMGGKSGALRAAVFGINDGLITNLSLIMFMAGAVSDNRIILITGVGGLLTGAFSMAAGEYTSMRVQREVFERLIHLEAHELATEPEEERDELIEIYRRKGIPAQVAEQVVDALHADPELALATHAREELGLDPEEGLGSPWGAAVSSFVTFAFGALVPLLPFILGSGVAAAIAAIAMSAVTLFTVGAFLTRLTGKRFYLAGLRMVFIAAAAATVTYCVGLLLHIGVTSA